MDLWIRSQNMKRLIKCNDIVIKPFLYNEIPTNEYCYNIIGYFNEGTEYEILGSYKTEERALKVLDEIQKLLMPIVKHTPIVKEDIKPEYIYKHYVNCGSNIEVIQLNTFVYEMPKE